MITNVFNKTFQILIAFVFLAGSAMGDFTRYQAILDRKPFGEIEIKPQAVADPKDSFAKHLEFRGIIEDRNSLEVSFFNAELKESFRLRVNETYEGITLMSADYDTEEAVLQKELEICTFSLKDEKTLSVTPPEMSFTQPQTALQRRSFSPDPNIANPLAGRKSASQPMHRGKTIESFLRENPDAVNQYPSPIRPVKSDGTPVRPPSPAIGRGETIEKFLRENPDALNQYPSPIRRPPEGSVAGGRGETIEAFMKERQQQDGQTQQQEMPVQQQMPEAGQITDEYGNILKPVGITPDGTPVYDYQQSE